MHSRTHMDRCMYANQRTIFLVFLLVMLFTSIFPSDGRQIWYNSQRIELLILKLITINKIQLITIDNS